MKKQSKKKRNPNFLSWIVDPIHGFFSPLLTKGQELLLKDFPKIADFNGVELIDGAIKSTEALKALVFVPPVPKSPEDAKVQFFRGSSDIEKGAAGVLATTTMAAAIPLTSLGDAIDEIWRLPSINALLHIASDTYTAGFDYGIKPFIQRFMQKKYTPLVPEAYRLAEMRAKGLIELEPYADFMAEQGLSHDWAMKWGEAQRIFPDVETLLTMWRRKLIIKGDVTVALQRMGYHPDWFDNMQGLKQTLVPPEVMAIAVQKEWITEEAYYKLMQRYGLNKTEAGNLYWTNEKIPDLGTLYNLKWRGLIDDKTFDRVISCAMYPGWLNEPIKKLATVIPPLPDLITMAVREAFGEHTYEEQMPALLEWGAKMGLSKEWVGNYWYAHWDRIALREMYSNLWRGYWDEDDFMRMLRIKDVHPDDRQAILDVAYLPPSIREMGYGYDMGVYTFDDIKRYRRMGGLSLEDAGKAADSLIRYRVSAEIEAVRREWLWSYAHGKIDAETYMNALLDLETPEEALQYWWDRAELQLERFKKPTPVDEGRIISSTEAKWAFKNGVRDEAWLRTALAELDWTSERIDLTIERLKLEIAEKEKPPTPPIRAISLSDLRRAFRYEIISEAAFRQEFEKRGYATEDINIIVTLELYRRPVPPPVKIPEITYSQLAGIFRRGIITESEFRSELAERGYVAEDIERLVTAEILKGVAPSPEITYRGLTSTQIRNLYRFGKLSETEIEPAFQKIGYSEKDASMLSQILIASEVTVETPRQLSRTDVARFYDMGVYSIAQVYDAYLDMGYTTEDSQGLALYTAVNIEFPDLRAMYKNGWISAEVMYNELVNIGLSPSRASELMMTVVKAEQPARLAAERDLTKSEIIKGVKAELITPLQARDMLMDMGYDEAEALFILAINKVIEAGDPEGYWDMRSVTEALKKARGLPSVEIPESALLLEKAIKEQKTVISQLKKEKAKEEDISTAVLALSRLEQQMVMLIKELKLA